MYHYGNGVPQNFQEALKWYRTSAELGDINAQRILGEMYLKGQNVQKDDAEAANWFGKAARQGDPKALNDLKAMADNKEEEMVAA